MMTTDEVAEAMGYASRQSIHSRIDRGDLKLAACRLPMRSRRCWSRQRLIAAGFLVAPPAPVLPLMPGADAPALTSTAVLATWRVA